MPGDAIPLLGEDGIGCRPLPAARLVGWVGVLPAIGSLTDDGTVLVWLVFAIIGVAPGQVVAGSDPGDRVALSIAARRPGVAVAIGATALPGQRLEPAALVLCLPASVIVCASYIAWRKHLHAAAFRRTPV
jgi:hypothetical protein